MTDELAPETQAVVSAEQAPEAGVAPEQGSVPVAAGFWVRAGAAVIDGLVIFSGLFLVALAAVFSAGGAERAPVLLIRLAGLAISGAYYVFLTGFSGQTLGKLAAGIQVVGKDDGHVSYARALGRWAAYFLSSVTLGVGYAIAALKGKRALHDYIAGTKVVYLPGTTTLRKRLMAGFGALSVVAMAGLFGLATLAEMERGAQAPMAAQELQEAAAIANLQSLRLIAQRYQDKFHDFPATLADLKKLEGFTELPELAVGPHAPAKDAEVYVSLDAAKLKDTGKWGYVAGPDASRGRIFIDCTHKDGQGREWYKY